jgi:hypothetical protein
MRKLIMLIALIIVAMISVGQDKSGKISTGRTTLNFPMNFSAADTINESDTYWVLVDCKQNYSHTQSVAITLDSVSGLPSIAIGLWGKTSTLDEYVQIVGDSTFTGDLASNPINLVTTTANKYRYFKILFTSTGTNQQTKVTALTFTDTYQNLATVLATTVTSTGAVVIGETTPNETTPSLTIKGDADSDAPDVTESLIIDLTANSTPTLATWGFTSTQGAGYTFDKNIATTGTIDNVVTNSAAAGDKGINEAITQVAGTALTGNLIGAGIVATNGTTTAPTGVVYGIEAKARAATSANAGGATIGRLTGVYASVDAKTKTATTMRAFEASLDGGAGGASTEAVAFEAFNNSSATQTSSYAFSANGGTAGGHKAYTADMRLQNGALVNNSSATQLTITENNVDVDGALTASSFTSDGAVKLLDDQILTLGTTTTNPVTKVTLEYDATTNGIGQLCIGDESNAQILGANATGTVQGATINLLHSDATGEGVENFEGLKSRVSMSGDGDAGVTMIGGTFRSYVLAGASGEVYGIQPWAKHMGTGVTTAMSGLSAKLDVTTDAFTASTVNAGHFHIDGASTVTGQFDGVMIEVYPAVTSMDNGLNIVTDNGAVVQNGISITGAYANAEISLRNAETISNANDGYVKVGGALTANSFNFCTAAQVTGGADSIRITNANLPPLAAGVTVMFVSEGTNTAALRFDYNGTVDDVYECVGAAPNAMEANDVRSGSIQFFAFDGTQWQQLNMTNQ